MVQIYIHGLGQTSDSWEKTFSLFEGKKDIIYPNLADLVKFQEVNYENLYSAFSDLCDKSGELVDLCGLSLGGILALNYAIDYPDKVHSLILIATQYKMPKRLLQFQNMIFNLMPNHVFQSTGFGKKDFMTLCKSMMELDFSESIDKITCPVLVVHGESDYANKKASMKLANILINSELKEIAGSGHEVNIDAPEKLAKLLYVFYEQIS